MKGAKNRYGIVLATLLLAIAALGGLSVRLAPGGGGAATQSVQPRGASGAGVSGPGYAQQGKEGAEAEQGWTHLDADTMMRTADSFSISPAVRDIKQPAERTPRRAEEKRESIPSLGLDQADTVVQSEFHPEGALAPQAMPAPIRNFEGTSLASGGSGIPPDTTGEVGPNHYVQMVNSSFAIYNKSGTLLVGPTDTNLLWQNAGGPCYERNDGDPIVLYDQLANRWLLTQFTAEPPYTECIAISQTGDPTGNYYLYSFFISISNFPDYPHFGVWPDAYYMGVNEFTNGQTYAGSRPYAFERARMLTGDPNARMMTTSSARAGTSLLMPSDLYGPTPPPAGAPNPFVEINRSTHNSIRHYKFAVNWSVPSGSFTGPTSIPVAGFTELCGSDCIPQPGTAQRLDGIGDRVMYRAAYRNFGTHQSLVFNHSVNANNYAGIRWYELRSPTGTPTLFQQGTYAPADQAHRWMGSIAMDRVGNLALGFSIVRSVAASPIYPSIRYAGRLKNDPAGTLAQGETTLINGSGSQIGIDRWGDYTDLTVDPTDDCTFWYVNEYITTSGAQVWRTRIGSFKFPQCSGSTPPTPTRTPIPAPTRTPAPSPTPVVCTPGAYTDVPPSNTFYPFVTCLSGRGIIGGYTDCTFRPNANVTRGQLSKIVSNAAGFDETPSGQSFTDVPTTNTFYLFIERMAGRGIIGGYSDGTFRPNNNATRGQISKIVANAAGFEEEPSGQSFTDVPPDNSFYPFVERMASRGIIGGYLDGTFRPNNNATRGQASKIVAGAFFTTDCQPITQPDRK